MTGFFKKAFSAMKSVFTGQESKTNNITLNISLFNITTTKNISNKDSCK